MIIFLSFNITFSETETRLCGGGLEMHLLGGTKTKIITYGTELKIMVVNRSISNDDYEKSNGYEIILEEVTDSQVLISIDGVNGSIPVKLSEDPYDMGIILFPVNDSIVEINGLEIVLSLASMKNENLGVFQESVSITFCNLLCQDSDGGKDYYVKGVMDGIFYNTTNASGLSDFCQDRDILTEYYCQDGVVYAENHTCDNYCQDGACVSELTTTTKPENFRQNSENNQTILILSGGGVLIIVIALVVYMIYSKRKPQSDNFESLKQKWDK